VLFLARPQARRAGQSRAKIGRAKPGRNGGFMTALARPGVRKAEAGPSGRGFVGVRLLTGQDNQLFAAVPPTRLSPNSVRWRGVASNWHARTVRLGASRVTQRWTVSSLLRLSVLTLCPSRSWCRWDMVLRVPCAPCRHASPGCFPVLLCTQQCGSLPQDHPFRLRGVGAGVRARQAVGLGQWAANGFCMRYAGMHGVPL
jgi:hypothetical protein